MTSATKKSSNGNYISDNKRTNDIDISDNKRINDNDIREKDSINDCDINKNEIDIDNDINCVCERNSECGYSNNISWAGKKRTQDYLSTIA